ncbi:MAG: VRR-NUC domain-containing protein [Candidatus Niameybacter stercoravium]|nr:VRR-NUC domain-containing protein [Candidatus Niameybacter stercoravium]
MLEKQIEQYLTKKVKSIGGLSLKLTALIGIPDRLVLLPGGICIFVELKAPGESPRRIQLKRMQQLRVLGFKVYVVDSYERVDEVMRDALQTT